MEKIGVVCCKLNTHLFHPGPKEQNQSRCCWFLCDLAFGSYLHCILKKKKTKLFLNPLFFFSMEGVNTAGSSNQSPFSSTASFSSSKTVLKPNWEQDKGLGNWSHGLVLISVEGAWDVVITGPDLGLFCWLLYSLL